jgi:hypothetical protein
MIGRHFSGKKSGRDRRMVGRGAGAAFKVRMPARAFVKITRTARRSDTKA